MVVMSMLVEIELNFVVHHLLSLLAQEKIQMLVEPLNHMMVLPRVAVHLKCFPGHMAKLA